MFFYFISILCSLFILRFFKKNHLTLLIFLLQIHSSIVCYLEHFPDTLPLYICRLSGVIFVLSYIFKSDKLEDFAASIGLIGPVLAILFPDMHDGGIFTPINLNFVIFHTALLVRSVKSLKNCDKNTLKHQFYFQIILTLILIFNIYVDKNYAYLISPPFFKDFFSNFSTITYFIFISSIYQLIIFAQSKLEKYILKYSNLKKRL